MRILPLLVLSTLGLAAVACGGSGDTDVSGSTDNLTSVVGDIPFGAERTEFMNMARTELYRQEGSSSTPIEFVVQKLKVQRGADGTRFAFMEAIPVLKGTQTPFLHDEENPRSYVIAKNTGHWNLMGEWNGLTDVPWENYPCDFGVPAALLDLPEGGCTRGR